MRRIRTYHDVAEPDSENVLAQVRAQATRLADRLADVGSIIVVASGKGGVGKSAVAANLAAAAAKSGQRTGAVDGDLNGPSLGRMLAAHGPLVVTGNSIEPATGAAGVRVMSMDLLLASDTAPVRWRGSGEAAFTAQSTLETSALREFLADVAWGALDVLVIDMPPGTDKLARLLELVPAPDHLVIVTTPSSIARFVVGKSIRAAREARVRHIGLVINMCSWTCPDCGRREALFDAAADAGSGSVQDAEVWAEIPFDPALAVSTDAGRPYVLEAPRAPAARVLADLARRLTGGRMPAPEGGT